MGTLTYRFTQEEKPIWERKYEAFSFFDLWILAKINGKWHVKPFKNLNRMSAWIHRDLTLNGWEELG